MIHELKAVTVVSPINIALVKYWGKELEDPIKPLNDSLSVTLCTNDIYTMTTVTYDSECEDKVFFALNGECQAVPARMQKMVSAFEHPGGLIIESRNSFPTSAGLASSSSGMAALATALCKLFPCSKTVYEVARLGSGSACRSLIGGFVQWSKDGLVKECFAQDHWDELRCIVVVVDSQAKKISSSIGMKRTVDTSSLFSSRLKSINNTLDALKHSIATKDFGKFAELIMRESNQLHAVCLDSYPPIQYLTPKSHQVIDIVHRLNQDGNIAGYTFDAGPNAFVFTLASNVSSVLDALGGLESTTYVCTVGTGPQVY